MKTRKIEWVTNEKGCHLVTSHSKINGYPQLVVNYKRWLMHRWVYTQHYGEIPEGLVIMHSCDNPSCINIEHLKLGTHQDNVTDKINKGRDKHFTGTRNKPKMIGLGRIRKSKGMSKTHLADITGLTRNYIYLLETGKSSGSDKVIEKLVNALNISINDLYEE